jgi:hypothetical protein
MTGRLTQVRASESTVRVTLEEWPLVSIRMPRVVDLKASFEFTRAIDTLLQRREQFVLVVDNRPTVDMPSVTRKAIASWEKSQDALLRAFAKAMAIVMPNLAMFAIAELISWLNKAPYPKKCSSTKEKPRPGRARSLCGSLRFTTGERRGRHG